MAQQGTQCTKRRKGMVSTVLLIIAAFLLLFLPGYLARIFSDDSAGNYKYCTLEHVDVHDRGGLVSGNTDYKRVADFKTKECGNLYMTDSPDPGRSMDDYVGSLEVGGYYKVTLLNVQMPDAKTVSVTRFEKVERPS